MSYSSFIADITLAYRHKGGTKTLALARLEPQWFASIQQDAATIIAGAMSSDVTDKGHVTNWTRPKGAVRQFSLFNSSGNSNDYTGDYGGIADTGRKRLVFPEKKAIARFAQLFSGSLRSLRLNGMGKSSALSPHEENSISVTKWGPQHIVRFHLPLFTNANSFVYLDGERFHYEEGTLYYFNHGCVHAASNDGDEIRYHFVLDCFLSRQLYDSVLSENARAGDSGFRVLQNDERHVACEAFPFGRFIREGGSVVEGSIDYGREVPNHLSWYKINYPSLFGVFP